MWRYPFLVITPCLILGIFSASQFLSYPMSFGIILLALAGNIIQRVALKSHTGSQIFILLALIAAGSLRLHLAQSLLAQDHIGLRNPELISGFSGIITQAQIGPGSMSRYMVSLTKIIYKKQSIPASGKLMLSTKNIKNVFQYGDTIDINSSLKQPPWQRNPGQFSYRKYLASQDVYHTVLIEADSSIISQSARKCSLDIIQMLRRFIRISFEQHLDADSKALADALLLGEKQSLDQEIISEFKKTGVVHVLAISGLHVGFIIAFVLAVTSILHSGPNTRLIILVTVLLIYVILVHFKPPVLRASLMAILVMVGMQMERSVNIYNIILAAAAMILFIDPRELLNPGFQFSFSAVLFIIRGHESLTQHIPVSDWLKQSRLYKWVWIPLLVSISATAGTLPLTWYYYGMIPVYAVAANLIVIPLTGALVLTLLILLSVAPISAYIAGGLGGLFSIIYLILKGVIHYFSNLPFASLELSKPPWFIVFLLWALLMIFMYCERIKHRLIILSIVFLIGIGFSIVPVQNRSLRVSFLDIGQGDATVVRFPNGNVMLVDAGDKTRYIDGGQKTIIPFLKHQRLMHIQYLVLSHPHHDHIGGMFSLLQTIKVDTVITTEYRYMSKSYHLFLSLCKEKQIPIKFVERGSYLYPDKRCRVYVLHPDTTFTSLSAQDGSTCNNASIVLKIQYGKNRILFTGDTEKDAEKYVCSYGEFLNTDLLKVAHHGSSTSTSLEFLNQTQPLVAVISVAESNKFKHPSLIILDRLQQSVPRIYQTDRDGALIFDVTPDMIRKIAWRQ